MSLALSDNLFDFFHERVEGVTRQQGRPISEEGVYYLTNLLVDRGRAPEATSDESCTLAELHIRAQLGSQAEAIAALRELGDSALYTSGFFRRSLSRRLVSLDYYLSMGAAAYDRLAALLRAPSSGHRGLDGTFKELAVAFAACSGILKEVRDSLRARGEASTPTSVLDMYEEWLRSGNPDLERRLSALGIIVGRFGDRNLGEG